MSLGTKRLILDPVNVVLTLDKCDKYTKKCLLLWPTVRLMTTYLESCWLGTLTMALWGVYNSLPNNVNDIMCTNNSRKGFLCGECMDTAGVAINALFNECAECSELYAVGMYFLLVIIPITVFFVFVFTFHLNFTSSPSLGYIVFCQIFIVVINQGVYQSVRNELDVLGQNVFSALLYLYGIWWYPVSVFSWISPQQEQDKLQMVCLQYAFVFYPLFLLMITYVCIELHTRDFWLVVYLWKPFHKCFAKVRRNWSASDSIIHAYATFLFLSLSNLATVTFDVLWATDAYSINGTITERVIHVVLEPTMEQFSRQHLQDVIQQYNNTVLPWLPSNPLPACVYSLLDSLPNGSSVVHKHNYFSVHLLIHFKVATKMD